MTVGVYASSGGALLASGTTDATGQVTLTWSGNNTPYVTVTGSARFVSYGQTLTVTCGTHTTTINLTVASGYVCFAGCALPLSTTLHVTDTVLGAATITYQTTGPYALSWVGTSTYNCPVNECPNGIGCPAVAVTLTWTYGAAGAGIGFGDNPGDDCPLATGVGPEDDSCTNLVDFINDCPPSFTYGYTLQTAVTGVAHDSLTQLYGVSRATMVTTCVFEITDPVGTNYATRTWTE